MAARPALGGTSLPAKEMRVFQPCAAHRRDRRGADRRHARRRRGGVFERLEQVHPRLRGCPRWLQIDGDDQQLGRVEAERRACQRCERAHEETRPDDHGERERHLCDDEHVTERHAAIAGDRPRLLLQRVARSNRRDAERGSQAEQERGGHCHGDHERGKMPVGRQVQDRRLPLRRQLSDEERAAPVRHEHAGDRTDASEKERLCEQLAGDTRAGCAQREPYAQIVTPRRCAREQEVGDVRAGDQQHRAHHAHHDGERARVAEPQRRASTGGRHERERIAQILLAGGIARGLCGTPDVRLHGAQCGGCGVGASD